MTDEVGGKESPDSSATDETGIKPKIIEVHGKAFDVNDPIQEAQLKVWDEAHAKLTGRQANELGQLRKFYEERKPSADDAELLAKAKAKAAEGDLDSAFDLVFSQAKARVSEVEKRIEMDRSNAVLWDEYLADRPELIKKFGRERIKKISESSVNLFDEKKDAFETLDAYWRPFYEPSKAESGKAPVTVTGASTRSGTSPKPAGGKEQPKGGVHTLLEAYTIGAKIVK